MPTPEDEVQWVLLAQCHDREALERLLRNVTPSLARYLRHLVGDEHADDVAQEVLIIVCKKIGWLRRAELFRPWLFRVASRAAFRYLKKEKRWSDQIRDPEVLDQVPGPPAVSRELARDLLSREHLTPASRAVLLLHFEEGMTLPEVAAVLEVPLGTVKSRLAYGLATLRKRMHDEEQDHDRAE
jgi:RNA polymerase sigma-70 factor (ECF subfamily)